MIVMMYYISWDKNHKYDYFRYNDILLTLFIWLGNEEVSCWF